MSSKDTCMSSGLLAASTAVKAAKGKLWGMVVMTDGANAATITLANKATAATTPVLDKMVVPGASICAYHIFPKAINASAGIYCTVAGTGASAIVFYE